MQVLHVDDDDDDREMFGEALKEIDPHISFIPIKSGPEAVDYLTAATILPDYIFIDINMPKMNGYECVEHIRLLKKDIRSIIMYSTTFNPRDQVAFARLGIKYLQKGHRFPGLVNSIRGFIEPEWVQGARP